MYAFAFVIMTCQTKQEATNPQEGKVLPFSGMLSNKWRRNGGIRSVFAKSSVNAKTSRSTFDGFLTKHLLIKGKKE